jgi:NADH:ubiquinone oxidoreductase subunit E
MRAVISHWSHENQSAAESILDQYPETRSALMPLLYVASLEHEYASDEAMREVADLTGISAAQVLSVASFYTMFKREPVGRYLISVCTSVVCYLNNADDVLEAVEGTTGVASGGITHDGEISVERVECIGACGGAPAVQVNYETVEGLTREKAATLVNWLRDAKPPVVLADEMQQLFGGQRSFDWGPKDPDGAVRPIPAFGPYGSVEEGR